MFGAGFFHFFVFVRIDLRGNTGLPIEFQVEVTNDHRRCQSLLLKISRAFNDKKFGSAKLLELTKKVSSSLIAKSPEKAKLVAAEPAPTTPVAVGLQQPVFVAPARDVVLESKVDQLQSTVIDLQSTLLHVSTENSAYREQQRANEERLAALQKQLLEANEALLRQAEAQKAAREEAMLLEEQLRKEKRKAITEPAAASSGGGIMSQFGGKYAVITSVVAILIAWIVLTLVIKTKK